ncbi:MAG TPA: GNAT family N-acetyltransferase [Pirellulaceae bacterium]|nr:GNAT family N-acetyltransferase [Pirellulaceae bacterium]
MNIDVTKLDSLTDGDIAAWQALQRANPDCDSPFLHYQFARCVSRARDDVYVATLRGCEKIGTGTSQLREILAKHRHPLGASPIFSQPLREPSEVLGFFPFQRGERRIGCGLALPLADHQGMVAPSDLSVDVRELLRACDLAAVHFDHLLASQTAFQPYHSRLDDSPYVGLTDGYAAYRQQVEQSGSSLFAQIDRKSRKVQRELGPLRLEWHDDSTSIVDTMIQWKQQQLAAAGYRDLYALPWVRELIHQVLHSDSSDFAGRMATLLAGDKLLSIHLGIQSGHVLASWIPTYNPAYAAHSPGLLLHDQLFRHAPLEGIERVELGRGYNQLKRRFMSGATQVAMGALDRRFLHRMVRATWYRTRDLVYATPLRRGPLRAYRKLRNQLAAAASFIGSSTRPLAVSSRFRRQPPRPTNGS